MRKSDMEGDVYMVLVDNEYAGWFHIPVGSAETVVLRAALSSNPTIVDMSTMTQDIRDLPKQASGWMWDGNKFVKNEE